jgi:AraC-like DNA-binding protein
MAEPTIHSPLAPVLVGLMRAAGGDVDAFCRRLGLPADIEGRLDIEIEVPTLRALFEEAARVTGDPHITLHLATAHRRGDYGVLELASCNAPNLGEALRRLTRYVHLVNPTATFNLTVDGRTARLDHSLHGRRPDQGRYMHEFNLGLIVHIGRLHCAGEWRLDRVWFAHAEPESTAELIRFFGTEKITFNRATNGFAFPAALLELALTSADATLLPILDRHAHLLLPKHTAAPTDLVATLRERIRASLGQGEAAAPKLARALGMSSRTLQRRLTELGISYQAVLDEVRHELALHYLEDPKLRLSEVAFLLGYSEFRAFLRAFKRWTGTTPGNVRARPLAG